jgi:hypothetical protein
MKFPKLPTPKGYVSLPEYLIGAIPALLVSALLLAVVVRTAEARRYDSCPRGGGETEIHKDCRHL